jgi:hypothetical protein
LLVVSLVALGLIAGAGVASAGDGDPTEEAAEDTLLNFGYDADNHIFLVNTSATDSTYDCTLENGTLTAQYGAADGGRIPVDMLLEEDKAVLFENRPEEDVGSDFTPAAEPVLYAGAEEACGISGGVVGGPNGQINHGQFMKLFHQLIDKRGMGCLNRIIAQSDLGKGDQKIRTSDVDPTFAPEPGGEVDFMTVAADCKRDKKDRADQEQTSEQGKKDKGNKSGRPDSPGNSANAPGHNK